MFVSDVTTSRHALIVRGGVWDEKVEGEFDFFEIQSTILLQRSREGSVGTLYEVLVDSVHLR